MVVLEHALGHNAGNSENLYKLSLLLELPHSGSLIVYDIKDGTLQRRGGSDYSLNLWNRLQY
ncbi:hypothetical protein [Borrelia sp. P9F1]|uniref:hypothetical protein n=1 Tax=Borrelia sp. P9F1 TaxID=3058374 RepID=UPI00345E9011